MPESTEQEEEFFFIKNFTGWLSDFFFVIVAAEGGNAVTCISIADGSVLRQRDRRHRDGK